VSSVTRLLACCCHGCGQVWTVVVVHAELCCTTSLWRSEFSCVVNFCLETVIITTWLCSEVVVSAACLLTTTSL